MSAITTPSYSPSDLLRLEQQGLFELVDGQLIEKPMGFLSGRTVSRITTVLGFYLQSNPVGELSSEATFQCFPNKPGRVRRPDLSFISSDRLPGVPDDGHVPIRPDLAIEVVSPRDGAYDLEWKLEDYEAAAIPLVWVFNPVLRNVRVYLPDGSSRVIRNAGILDGGTVLPGFASKVEDLIPSSTSGG